MTTRPVVSNASPLIALQQINRLELLEKLFSSLLVPPAVVREAASVKLPPWIVERAPLEVLSRQILGVSLGAGESEAISLALEVQASWVILDDRPPRRMAQALGLPVIGTLGVLVASKRRGFLPRVEPCLTALANLGFRVSPQLYELVLADAGEQPSK